MNEENISGWVQSAKANEAQKEAPPSGVKVVRKEVSKSRGAMIMEIAEKLLPAFRVFFKDHRDTTGMLLQPTHVRGIALNYAEYLIKSKEQDSAAA